MRVVRPVVGAVVGAGVLILFLAVSQLFSRPAYPRIERLTLEEPSLIRYIERRDSLAGSIACQPNAPFLDVLFLGRRWNSDFVLGATDCNYCDTDQDGLSGCFELILTTEPDLADTDGDCLGDGLELLLDLNPLVADTIGDGTMDGDRDTNHNGIPDRDDDYDGDGLTNCAEVTLHHTNPLEADTDFDRLKDGDEITRGTNPLVADSDHDGFIDGEEVEFDSDPLDAMSLPVDPTIDPGRAVAVAFSVENLAFEPAQDALAAAMLRPFSLENQLDPTEDIFEGATVAVFSLENRLDPTEDSYGAAMAAPFALRNDFDPTEGDYGAAMRAPFSIQNTTGGKAAAGPLRLLPKEWK